MSQMNAGSEAMIVLWYFLLWLVSEIGMVLGGIAAVLVFLAVWALSKPGLAIDYAGLWNALLGKPQAPITHPAGKTVVPISRFFLWLVLYVGAGVALVIGVVGGLAALLLMEYAPHPLWLVIILGFGLLCWGSLRLVIRLLDRFAGHGPRTQLAAGGRSGENPQGRARTDHGDSVRGAS